MRRSRDPDADEEIGRLLFRIEGLAQFLGFSRDISWEEFRRAYDTDGSFDLPRFMHDLDEYQPWKDAAQRKSVTIEDLASRLLDQLAKAESEGNQSIKEYIEGLVARVDWTKIRKD